MVVDMDELLRKSIAAVVAILSIAVLADWHFPPQTSLVRPKLSRVSRHQLSHSSSPEEIYNYSFELFKELPSDVQEGILKYLFAGSVEVEKLQSQRGVDYLNRTLTVLFDRVPPAVHHFHYLVLYRNLIEESQIDETATDLALSYNSYGGLFTLVAIVSLLAIPPYYGLKNSFFKVKTFDLRGGQGTQDGTGTATLPEASLDVQ